GNRAKAACIVGCAWDHFRSVSHLWGYSVPMWDSCCSSSISLSCSNCNAG
ncbi:UNVERIFIED_CONTAM: hypothetical protein Slati_2271300, partial [Sesamum latifolium]